MVIWCVRKSLQLGVQLSSAGCWILIGLFWIEATNASNILPGRSYLYLWCSWLFTLGSRFCTFVLYLSCFDFFGFVVFSKFLLSLCWAFFELYPCIFVVIYGFTVTFFFFFLQMLFSASSKAFRFVQQIFGFGLKCWTWKILEQDLKWFHSHWYCPNL